MQEVFTTLYNNLGINTQTATVTDLKDRSHYLTDKACVPLPEVA